MAHRLIVIWYSIGLIVLVCFVSAMFPGSVFAQEFSGLDPLSLPKKWSADYQKAPFVAPTEFSPLDMSPITNEAKKGLYVSVGTDRGFIGAALSNANHLLLLDHNPDSVLFNRLNIALLKISKDRGDYMNLRLHASPDEFMSRAAAASVLNAEEKQLLLDKDVMQGFRNLLSDPQFGQLHKQSGTFRGANYIYGEGYYRHLKNLADQGKIEAYHADLAAKETVDAVTSHVKAKRLKLGVIDLSNAWEEGYIHPDRMEYLLKRFSESDHTKSIFLFTNTPEFKYFALSGSYVREQPAGSTSDFFRTLIYIHTKETGSPSRSLPDSFFGRINGFPTADESRQRRGPIELSDKVSGPYAEYLALAKQKYGFAELSKAECAKAAADIIGRHIKGIDFF